MPRTALQKILEGALDNGKLIFLRYEISRYLPEVESATAGLDVAPLPQEVEVLQLVTVEVSGDVDLLAPHDDDLLPVEDELGDDGGQTPKHVGAAVNDNSLGCEARHSSENEKCVKMQ